MSDDTLTMILAALRQLEAGQAELRGDMKNRLDQFEGKLDKVTAEIAQILPRMTASELETATRNVRAATAHSRIDALDVRLSLIERRLELRDQA